MIVPGRTGFTFNRADILLIPKQSGVYALYSRDKYIYIGEGQDIQARLLAHLEGDNARITRMQPTAFQVEAVSAEERVARQDALILGLGTMAPEGCNQRLG